MRRVNADSQRVMRGRAPIPSPRGTHDDPATPMNALCKPADSPIRAKTSSTAPISALESGPTMVMRNSSLGFVASDRIRATPPKMNSVIPSTWIPRALAITEWASSCNRTEAKKSDAPTRAMVM